MAKRVIGQTGRTVLSNDTANRNITKRRTLRYRYEKCANGYWAVVMGPFHSRRYGVCGFGMKRPAAKRALIGRLANDYGYFGNLIFSDIDEGDNIGNIDTRSWDKGAVAKPFGTSDVYV